MAALGSTQFDQFAFPLSNPPFCTSNILWPSEPSYSIPSLNASGSKKIRRPAAAPSRSSQTEAESNTVARAEGTWKSYTESEIVLICLIQIMRALLLTMMINQTTIFQPSRSSLRLLCVRRSRLRPRGLGLPFSVQNNQRFRGLDCKSTEHSSGRGVEVGAPSALCAQERSANCTQVNQ